MDLFSLFTEHGITYTRFDHPAVFTTEESNKLPPMPGADTKNLFLCDRNQTQFFLVTVPHDMRADLKALGKLLNVKDITFGSAEKLQEYLGVSPGSVTLLGVLNDRQHHVQVWIDESIWSQGSVQCHPLVNTATLVMPRADLQKFLELTGHPPQVATIPRRAA